MCWFRKSELQRRCREQASENQLQATPARAFIATSIADSFLRLSIAKAEQRPCLYACCSPFGAPRGRTHRAPAPDVAIDMLENDIRRLSLAMRGTNLAKLLQRLKRHLPV